MPAAAAYQASLENFEELLRRNRRELNDLIKKATERGEFKVVYDRQMFSGIQTWLEDYGYDVSQKMIGDRKVWVVSWERKGSGGS